MAATTPGSPGSVVGAPTLDPRPPQHEYRQRLARFRKGMQAADIDILIATTPEHLNYLTGFDPLGIYLFEALLIPLDERPPALLTHKAEAELARAQVKLDALHTWSHGQDPTIRTVELLREFGVRLGSRVGVEKRNWYLQAGWYEQLCDALPDVVLVDATDIGQEARIIKSPWEIEHMRRAAGFADLGLATAIEKLRPGVREIDLSASVLEAMARAGSEYAALPMIIGSGERSALFHVSPTARVIEDGDPVFLEISGVSSRYNSNIVRTVVVGTASPMLRTLHDIVYEAFWRPFALIRPGEPVAAADQLSRDIRGAYAEHIPARAGFGMGLAYPPVWLGRPDILVTDEHIFEPGMVVSLEPSIAHFRGVSMIYGYNILVTDTGAEVLHKTPAELFEV